MSDLVDRIRNGTINIYRDLRGVNLAGADLHFISFQGADLRQTNFEGANLTGCNFEDANLKNANLKNAHCINANFDSTDLRNANLERANLSEAIFESGTLEGARLEEVVAINAVFSETNISNANLNNANLESCEFTGGANVLDFSESTFVNANLQKATFIGVDLTNADFTDASMQMCYMDDTGLVNVELTGANITHMFIDLDTVNTNMTSFDNVIGYDTIFTVVEEYNEFMLANENPEEYERLQAQRNEEELLRENQRVRNEIIIFGHEMFNRYHTEFTANNQSAVNKYTGPVNLNLEIVDLYDLTYDDNNNKIEWLDNFNNFLNHDLNNIIFIFNNNLFFSNKRFILKSIGDEEYIKYACVEANGLLNVNNVRQDTPYITLKSLGLYGGLITMMQAIGILTGQKRIFIVLPTNQTLASTVSRAVLNNRRNSRVSGSHCQEGQGEIVYNVEFIEMETPPPQLPPPHPPSQTIGGKKRKTIRKQKKERKTRKGKKVRNTRRRGRK